MQMTMKNISREKVIMAGVAAAALMGVVASDLALAGTGGGEFEDLWIQLSGWMSGTLGKVISGAMILVGIIGGVARQSLMAFAVGIGGGIGLYNSAGILDSVMGATISNADKLTQAAMTISNGL